MILSFAKASSKVRFCLHLFDQKLQQQSLFTLLIDTQHQRAIVKDGCAVLRLFPDIEHILPTDAFVCCEPRSEFLWQVHHKSLSLGEVLDGDRMAESLYHIRFRENVEKKTLCQLTLSEKQVWMFALQIPSYSPEDSVVLLTLKMSAPTDIIS